MNRLRAPKNRKEVGRWQHPCCAIRCPFDHRLREDVIIGAIRKSTMNEVKGTETRRRDHYSKTRSGWIDNLKINDSRLYIGL